MPVARFCNVNLSELGNTTSGKSGPVATCGRCTGREGETGDPARTGAKLEFIHGKCVYCRWVHGKWVTAGCNVCCTSPHLLLRCDFFRNLVCNAFGSLAVLKPNPLRASSRSTSTGPAIRRTIGAHGHRPSHPTATCLTIRRPHAAHAQHSDGHRPCRAMSLFNFLYCILMVQDVQDSAAVLTLDPHWRSEC